MSSNMRDAKGQAGAEGEVAAGSGEAAPVQEGATVRALGRRAMVLAAIMVPVIVLTVLLVTTQARGTLKSEVARQAIPEMIDTPGDLWTSSANAFSDAEMDILETRDYVYRTYSDGRGKPVDLCVIFSEDNRKGTHPPDVCLEGGGRRIMQRMDRDVVAAGTKLKLRELVTAYEGRYTYFAYFYKCGDSFTPSFYWQQATIVWNGLTRQNAAGALVRYSTPMTDGAGLEAARARVDELLQATFPSIRDKLNASPR
jgi:EpsI family protein